MRVIIAGDRRMNNYSVVEYYCAIGPFRVEEVVSGKAAGADYLGEQWARSRGLPITPFPANWIQYGKAAGPIRNKQMADYADALIAFIAPGSKGTRNMVMTMLDAHKPIYVIPIEVEG